MPKDATEIHPIEAELAEVAKITRKKGEEDADFFKRAQAKVDALPPEDWEKLSEPTQLWSNAAGVALDTDAPIPNFDGQVPTAEENDGQEPAAAEKSADDSKESTVETKKTRKKAAAADKKAAPAEKETKKTTAKKGAADKEATGKRGRKGSFNDDSKITKVAGENPFREGSKAADLFKQYKVGRTVKQVLAAGVPRSKLARHAKKGVITIG